MCRHQDEPTRGVGNRRVQCGISAGNVAFDGVEQSIDDGIAGHVDGLRGDVLAQKVLLARGGRRKMEGRELADELAIGLLGERRPYIAGAQPGFDMDDGQFAVETREGRGEGRGCVPLDEDGVGLAIVNDAPDPIVTWVRL